MIIKDDTLCNFLYNVSFSLRTCSTLETVESNFTGT